MRRVETNRQCIRIGDQQPPAKRLTSTHKLTVRVQTVRLIFVLAVKDITMFTWLQKLFETPPLPVTTVMGKTYSVVGALYHLKRAMDSEHPVLYRFNTAQYTDELKLLANFMDANFGSHTPERAAVTGSPKVCSKCLSVFSEMWGVRSVYGEHETCPNCGHDVAYIALDIFRPEDISQHDIDAIKVFYKLRATNWWNDAESKHVSCSTQRACDGTQIERGYGYLRAGSIACDLCIDDILDGCLDELKGNPYYLGNDLWFSRITIASCTAFWMPPVSD